MLMGAPWLKLSPTMEHLMMKFQWKMLKSQKMRLVAILRKSGPNSLMENHSIMVLDFNDSKFGFGISNFKFWISTIVMKKNEKNIHSA